MDMAAYPSAGLKWLGRTGLVLYMALYLIWAGPLASALCAAGEPMVAHWAHRALLESVGIVDDQHDLAHRRDPGADPLTRPDVALPLVSGTPAVTMTKAVTKDLSGSLFPVTHYLSSATLAVLLFSVMAMRLALACAYPMPMLVFSPSDPPPRVSF